MLCVCEREQMHKTPHTFTQTTFNILYHVSRISNLLQNFKSLKMVRIVQMYNLYGLLITETLHALNMLYYLHLMLLTTKNSLYTNMLILVTC